MNLPKEQNIKLWILPDGKIENLGKLWHYQWIIENISKLKKYGMNMEDLGTHTNEGPVRLYALSKGFVRVNYTINGGRLVIEAPDNNWSRKIRDSIFDFISDNVSRIDQLTITILRVGFPNKVSIKKTATTNWISHGGNSVDKLNQIPFITETKEMLERRIVPS